MTDATRLARYLIQCCYWYYVKTQPVESDQTYDRLLHLLEEMERKPIETMESWRMWAMSPTGIIWDDCEAQYPEWARVAPDAGDVVWARGLLDRGVE